MPFDSLLSLHQSTGTRTFRDDKDIAWAARWPLLPGKYQAVTIRDGDIPFERIDRSATFEVSAPDTMGEDAIKVLRTEIENLIIGPTGDITLASKFLRLGFHDCVGGCDGCVSTPNLELI